MPAGCTDKKYICKYQTDDTLGDRCVPSLRAAKITLTCGGADPAPPPLRDIENYLLGGFRRKKNVIQRAVT